MREGMRRVYEWPQRRVKTTVERARERSAGSVCVKVCIWGLLERRAWKRVERGSFVCDSVEGVACVERER